MVLSDGVLVCWMTANGKLSASFSCDGGEHWHINPRTGKPHMLDPECYGYPGGVLLDDESICVVYYDAVRCRAHSFQLPLCTPPPEKDWFVRQANEQQRTSVWNLRFRVSAARDALEVLPPLAEERLENMRCEHKPDGPVVTGDSTKRSCSGREELEAFDTDACSHATSRQSRKRVARL